MATLKIPGLRQYTTNRNPRAVNQLDITEALNVYWNGNSVEARDGITLWKNDTQTSWGRIIKARTFKKRADTFFYVVVVMNTGRVFYIKSDNASFGSSGATWTELNSSSSSTPALAASATKYDLFPFNDRLYLADSTNGYFSWNGTDADLTAETDPPSLSTNNIVNFETKSNRLAALDDGGLSHLSAVNDGQDFTAGSGGGSLNYGRVEGLIATNLVPFGDDLVVTTEDTLSIKYQAYELTGIQFFDPAVAGTDTSQFEVRKINPGASIVGDSGQEITGDTIGLTPDGFVSLRSISQKEVITERDFLSFPIKELIEFINFEKADKISSAVDGNGRYYCAVPFGLTATEANTVFVYDFRRSSPVEGIHRWSVLEFSGFGGDIGTIFTIQNHLYVTDTLGNIYKANDPDASYSDVNDAGTAQNINYLVKTAAIGGDEIGIEKEYGTVTFLLTNLFADFNLSMLPVIDGKTIREDIDSRPFQSIPIELPAGELLYDTGELYDVFNLYDSGGTNQRVVSSSNRGGRANSIQWQFSTNTTGVSWGLGALSVEVDGMEVANEPGEANTAVI